jgi:hypothetical protein
MYWMYFKYTIYTLLGYQRLYTIVFAAAVMLSINAADVSVFIYTRVRKWSTVRTRIALHEPNGVALMSIYAPLKLVLLAANFALLFYSDLIRKKDY